MSNLFAKIIKIFLFIVLLYNIPLTLIAAPSTSDLRIDSEAQNRKVRQEEQDRRYRERKPDIFLQQSTERNKKLELPVERPSFLINKFVLEGDRLSDFPWIQPLLDEYAGVRIGKDGINVLAKLLTDSFIDRGYITTRILIPEQNLSTGVLRFRIIPGVIKGIQFTTPIPNKRWHAAFPIRSGDLLNLRDLEQGLEQMKRVPSQDVKMQLLPGNQFGESIVNISVQKTNPVKCYFSFDNSGNKSTGKLQASETISYDNLFGINDLFHVTFNSDAVRNGQAKGTRGDSLYYSFPQGYWTYTISHSFYQYHQTITSNGQPFLASGKMDNWELDAEKLIHRDQSQKTSLALRLLKGLNKYFVNDTEIVVQRQTTTAVQLAILQKKYNGQSVLDWELAVKRGVPWFGAQQDPREINGDAPTTRYTIWTIDANLTAPIEIVNNQAKFRAVFHGQFTNDNIFSSEWTSIGNRYTVRGFDGEETLSAEKGWYCQNEVSFPMKNLGNELYVGVDYGQISCSSSSISLGGSLIGSVLGLRGALKEVQYDVYFGWPIKKPDKLNTAAPTVGFQFIYQI